MNQEKKNVTAGDLADTPNPNDPPRVIGLLSLRSLYLTIQPPLWGRDVHLTGFTCHQAGQVACHPVANNKTQVQIERCCPGARHMVTLKTRTSQSHPSSPAAPAPCARLRQRNF